MIIDGSTYTLNADVTMTIPPGGSILAVCAAFGRQRFSHSQSSYDYHDSRAQNRHEMCMDTFHRGHGLFKPLTVKDDYDDTGIRWKPEAW